ncbi:ABC transporter permease [Cytobacillus dafuensis]|uniref:ABC transporter permease n=1 Tax=Cytobacillus dafuensis TaxID=1742359 RepID=A0A5B8Z0L1_CYTDA|nr:ABC transporter permease [Cytobacillus dafuensis]QED46247.1 ABC transporter permease [Cytobacillus dafuensis]
MGKLIINEWVKVFRRIGTLIMIALIVLFVIGFGGLSKVLDNQNPPQENTQWKQELEKQLLSDRSALEDIGQRNANLKMYYERQIAIKEYQLENDIPPQTETHMWTFVNEAQAIISFAGLFTIIIAAGIVSSEFSWGTIKLLLIRPYGRSSILLSKYITVILYGFFFLAILYTLSVLVGFVLFGAPAEEVSHLAYINGEVVERNIVVHLISQYLLSSIDVLLVATMAFMISTVFRNSSLAIGLSLFLLFTGSTATMLLASKFEWTKYFLFANTNLTVYFDGVPPVEGMTLSFSIMMLIIYFAFFHLLAFLLFNKRDVAA